MRGSFFLRDFGSDIFARKLSEPEDASNNSFLYKSSKVAAKYLPDFSSLGRMENLQLCSFQMQVSQSLITVVVAPNVAL